MATLKPFCNLTNLFSSITFDNEYEKDFWDEIFGCVNYMKLPYETVMNMPVYIRKLWINRHNQRCQEEKEAYNKENGGYQKSDISINAYAKLEQQNKR